MAAAKITFLEDSDDEESLEQTIVEEINASIEDYRFASQDAKFIDGYDRYRDNITRIERLPFGQEYKRALEAEFDKLWTKYADSAVFHPPYVVPCEEGSWHDTVMRVSGTPCVGGVMVLKDTLTRRFTVLVPSGAAASSRNYVFRPKLWLALPATDAGGNSAAGPPQDLCSAETIVRQYEKVYEDNGLDPDDGARKAYELFKRYFDLEYEKRNQIIQQRLQVLETQRDWKITIKTSNDTESAEAALRTTQTAEERIREFEEDHRNWEREGKQADALRLDKVFEDNLEKSFQLEIAQDRIELQKLKMGFDPAARQAFRESKEYREYEARRRYETTQLRMTHKKITERLMILWSSGGMTRKMLEQIALDLEKADDEHKEALQALTKRFDTEKSNLLEAWRTDPTRNNGSHLSIGAALVSRATEYTRSVQELENLMSDDITEYETVGDDFAADVTGRSNDGRSTRSATRYAVDGRKIDFQKLRKRKARQKIAEANEAEKAKFQAKLQTFTVELENAEKTLESLRNNIGTYNTTTDEGNMLNEANEQHIREITEEIQVYRESIAFYEQKLVDLGVSAKPPKRRRLKRTEEEDSESDDDDVLGAAATDAKKTKGSKFAKKKKTTAERLTATFGAPAEVIPETLPAAADVSTAKPPAVVKKKRRARKKKKTGLATKKTEPKLELGNLIL